MKYKAIVFDLDGVICFTDQYHYQAWKALADRLGIPFDEEVNHQLRGVSRMESLEIILRAGEQHYSSAEKEQLAEEKNKNYQKLLQAMSPADVPADVETTLKELRTLPLQLAIGSSSRNASFILHQIGLKDFFDAVADGTQITHSKPHPEVFLLAAKLVGVLPESCLVVEDAMAGIAAAHAAGMDSAAVGDAVRSPLATYRLEKLSDLIPIVQSQKAE